MTTQEKQALYRAVRQEIHATGNKASDVCKKYSLSPKAYTQWAYRQRINEREQQVITLKPDQANPWEPKTVAIVLGLARFELRYSDQDELAEIVRLFRNV